MKKYNAKATFFIIGNRATEVLLTKIKNSGHELANHSFSDQATGALSQEQARNSIEDTHVILEKWQPIHWFRPGLGSFNDQTLQIAKNQNYRVVLADVFPYDHFFTSETLLRRYITHSVKPGSIIVLHDYQVRGERTARVLTKVIPKLQQRGYSVVSLGEMSTNKTCAPA